MKHGPIALIDEELPVVIVAPRNETYEKVISNLEEVKARAGKVIVISSGDAGELAEHVITSYSIHYTKLYDSWLSPGRA